MRGGKPHGPPTRRGRKPLRIDGHETGVDHAPGSRESLVMRGIAAEIAAVLGRFGTCAGNDLQAAPLATAQLAEKGDPMSVAGLGGLMVACAAQANCPHFGLLVGQRSNITTLGLLGCLMPRLQTVGIALRNLAWHLQQPDRAPALTLTVDDGMAHLSYAMDGLEGEGSDQVADGAMATAMDIMRILCGPDWAPTEVLLPRPAPSDLGPFTQFFRVPVRFGARRASLIFPASWLHRRMRPEVVLGCLLADRLRAAQATSEVSFGDRVRNLLRAQVPSGNCSAEEVARLFSMHRRTLNRHLHQEGLTFNTMVNEVRFEIARQLLTDAGMTLGQVAEALSFSEPSAFTRAFRRWSGQTPSAWQAQHRLGHLL